MSIYRIKYDSFFRSIYVVYYHFHSIFFILKVLKDEKNVLNDFEVQVKIFHPYTAERVRNSHLILNKILYSHEDRYWF